ncbi:MAG: hypothetical protein ACTHOF_06595 [Flavisolibacter sp.]
MKKALFCTHLMAVLCFLFFVISSCKKELSDSGLTFQQEENIATIASQSETETELVFNDVFDNVIGVNAEVGLGGTGVFGRTALNGRENGIDSVPSCVTLTVTHLNAPDIFPVKVVVDFGGGCRGKDGHTRSGKIITTYSGRLTVPGQSATTIFDGFVIDSISVQGKHIVTNTTLGSQRQFTVHIIDAKLAKPDGNSQWTSQRIITQVEGNGTPDLAIDDAFTITGFSHGKVESGSDLFAWQSEIAEPLWKRFACHWTSKGVLKVWRETLASNSPWAAILNYGDGTCDFLAALTINGTTKPIKLPY